MRSRRLMCPPRCQQRVDATTALLQRKGRSGRLLQTHVLQRGRVGKSRDEREASLFHARAKRADEAVLPDPREYHALAEHALDLVEHLLALAAIHLRKLLLEEGFDLGDRAVGIDALGGHIRL